MATLSDEERLLDEIERVVRDAEAATKPLEVEPYRGRLFDLFGTAFHAGLVVRSADDPEGQLPPLSADDVCRELGRRWGLTEAMKASAESEAGLSGEQLGRMRLLWSVTRLWLEWSYAWTRWAEFAKDE